MKKRGIVLFSIMISFLLALTKWNAFFVSGQEKLPVWLILGVFLALVCYVFFSHLIRVIMEKGKDRSIFLYMLPYLLILVIAWKYRCVDQNIIGLVGDESNIYNEVIKLNLYPYHFGVYTGLYYALSLMIIPNWMGPIIIKLLLQAYVCGYTVYRVKKYWNNSIYIYMTYFLFLSSIFIETSYFIHRMYIYALLYLVLIVKMTMDCLEKKMLEKHETIIMFLSGAILTIWRREGIYLLIILPIMFVFCYKIEKKKIIRMILIWVGCLGIVCTPEFFSYTQKGVVPEDLHTYNAVLTHMCRKGLDWEKYPDKKDVVSKVVDLDKVNALNAAFGDANYQDEWIAWREGYVGIKAEVTEKDVTEYKNAVIGLILKEPFIFLDTRIGSFNFSAWSTVKNSNNWIETFIKSLYLPIMVIVIFLFSALRKKAYYFVWLAAGLLVHTGITTLLTPAGYYKYYLHMYVVGMFLLLIGVFVCLEPIMLNELKKSQNQKNVYKKKC